MDVVGGWGRGAGNGGGDWLGQVVNRMKMSNGEVGLGWAV